MKAINIMTTNVVTAYDNITVREAVTIMCQKNVGALIIQTPRPTFGIFTQGDLLNRVVAADKDPATTPISEVLTETTMCAQINDDLDELLFLRLKV